MYNNLTIAFGAILALISVGGLVWLSRIRAAKRWNHFLDGYAAQEIIRARWSSAQEK